MARPLKNKKIIFILYVYIIIRRIFQVGFNYTSFYEFSITYLYLVTINLYFKKYMKTKIDTLSFIDLMLPGFLNLQLPGVSDFRPSLALYTGTLESSVEIICSNCCGEIHSSSGIPNNHGKV